jgi:hypothetical protein
MKTGKIASGKRWIVTAACLTSMGLVSGCMDGKLGRQFRDAAASSLQTGFLAVADGLINGAIAVFDPSDSDDSSSSN